MIEPGIGTEEFKLGEEVDLSSLVVLSTEERGKLKVYKTKSAWLFVNSQNNKLDQVSLFHPTQEKVLGKVGLGDNLSKVHLSFGKCSVNNNVHEPLDNPGVAFETEKGANSMSAKIVCISVSLPFQFYGELPGHIKNDLPNKQRKLP